MKLFGRKFIINRILTFAENNLDEFKAWLDKNIDIPGVDDEGEAQIINMVTGDTINVLRAALNGTSHEVPYSKRMIMEYILGWLSTIAARFIRTMQIPFISHQTDAVIDELVVSLIENDLRPYVAAHF